MASPFRVSGATSVNRLAGAIAKTLRECGHCELQACGAGAVNQAAKAVAVARTFVLQDGLDLRADIGFVDVQFDGEDRVKTALRFDVTASPLAVAA
jgi:stage V sporulation protein S